MVRLWTTETNRSHQHSDFHLNSSVPALNSPNFTSSLNSSEETEQLYDKLSYNSTASQNFLYNVTFDNETTDATDSITSVPPSEETEFPTEEAAVTVIPINGSEKDSTSDKNKGTDENNSELDFAEISRPIALDFYRVPKTILYTCVSMICFIALGMLIHLLVFHAYIGCKGLTTYEYLKPPTMSSTKSDDSRRISCDEGNDAADGNGNGGGVSNNKSSYKNGSGKAAEAPVSIEHDSDGIWSTMTEIDLNAPDGATLPRDLNNKLHPQRSDLEMQNEINSLKSNGEGYLVKNYAKNKERKQQIKPYRGLTGLLGINSSNKIKPNSEDDNSS
jgi:hypothetical protein